MPSRFRLRFFFKPLVASLAKRLANRGMTPNNVTGLMLVFSIACFTYLLFLPLNWLTMVGFGVLVFITGILDGVDGAIARFTNSKTRFGGVLDSSMDRISDAIIFFVPAARELLLGDLIGSSWFNLPWFEIIPLWIWSIALVIGAYMTSYVRTRVTLADPSIDVDVGLLGRSERLFAIVLASALNILPTGIYILSILTNITAIFRIKEAKASLVEKKG